MGERVTRGLLRGRLRLSQYLVGCGRWDGRDDETTTRNRSYVDRAVRRDYCRMQIDALIVSGDYD